MGILNAGQTPDWPTLPRGHDRAETVVARKATCWDRREYRLRWRTKSERDKGTSWKREGSPFRPTKIRGKPDRTGNVRSSESQRSKASCHRRGRVQVSESRNIQRRWHFCKFSPEHPRHSTQPTARARVTASIPAQHDASHRPFDLAVIAGTQRNTPPGAGALGGVERGRRPRPAASALRGALRRQCPEGAPRRACCG